MSLLAKGVLLQTAADTLTDGDVALGVIPSLNQVATITAVQFFIPQLNGIAIADGFVSASLFAPLLGDGLDAGTIEMMRLDFAQNGGNGVIVIEPKQELILLEPWVTAQSAVKLRVDSFGTGLANAVYYRVYGTIDKLKDVDYLRVVAADT